MQTFQMVITLLLLLTMQVSGGYAEEGAVRRNHPSTARAAPSAYWMRPLLAANASGSPHLS